MTYTRIFRLVIVLWALMLVMTGCGSSGIDLTRYEREGYEIRTYEVFGMDCPGCHGGLEKLVNGVPGVITSRANWEKQRLDVVVDPQTTVADETVFAAVREANFTPGRRVK